MAYANPFELINEEIEKVIPPTQESYVEAYQIIKIQKMTIGKPKRIIVDTIMVEKGLEEYAKERALSKGRMIRNCMVVEKIEKIVGQY